MDGILSLLLILYIVYLDSRTLRQESEHLYDNTMTMPPFAWAVLVFLLLIGVLPIYLYKRHKFLMQLNTMTVIPVDNENDASDQEAITSQAIAISEHLPLPFANPFFSRVIETTGVILVWSLALAVLNISNFIFSKLYPVSDSMLMQFVLRSVLSNIIMIYLIYYAIKANREKGFWESLYVRKSNRFFTVTFILPIALGVSLAAINYTLLMSHGIQSQSPLRQAITGSTPAAIFFFIFSALVTAPLLEELIFRGYFFTAIQKIKGKWFAVLSISLIFAIFHVEQLWGEWLAILLIGGLSFGLTLLRAWSGTTLPGIVMHYAYNISMFIVVPILALFFSNMAFFEYSLKSAQLEPIEKEHLLQQNIDENPDFIPAYNHLAWLYAEEDKSLNEALHLIEIALASEPENPAYLDTKAEVLYKMGKYDEAIAIESSLCEKYDKTEMFKKQLDKFISAKRSKNQLNY